jgi:hypothetical protein
MSKMRLSRREEQIERHAALNRDSFSVQELKAPLFKHEVPRYYVLMYLEFLLDTKQRPGTAARLIGTDQARKAALQILERVSAEESDERLDDWKRVCLRTDKEKACFHDSHAEIHFRKRADFQLTPNAVFYDNVKPKFSLLGQVIDDKRVANIIAGNERGKLQRVFCTCASDNSITLCNNQSHIHSNATEAQILSGPESEDAFRECAVSGLMNQNIISCAAFGERGSRERWMILRNCISRLYLAPHGGDMCNSLDRLMENYNDETNAARCCLAQFTYSTHTEAKSGKSGDRELPLPEHALHRLRNSGMISATDTKAEHLHWYHPHHSRIYAANPVLLTIAIQLFSDATEWEVWHSTVWREWCRIVLTHCKDCELECREAMMEGLSFIFFCAALHPISGEIIANIEQLLVSLQAQR